MVRSTFFAVAVLCFVPFHLMSGNPASAADDAIPDFAEMRAQFQKGHVPLPEMGNELRIAENWSCKSAYADPERGKFSGVLFDFLTCLENNYCIYNNRAQFLPAWVPAWFSYVNHGEFGVTPSSSNPQFTTDQPISSCSGDITKCDLKRGGPFQNDMHIRTDHAGHVLVEWTTTGVDSLKWDSIVAPEQKAVLYSVCEL